MPKSKSKKSSDNCDEKGKSDGKAKSEAAATDKKTEDVKKESSTNNASDKETDKHVIAKGGGKSSKEKSSKGKDSGSNKEDMKDTLKSCTETSSEADAKDSSDKADNSSHKNANTPCDDKDEEDGGKGGKEVDSDAANTNKAKDGEVVAEDSNPSKQPNDDSAPANPTSRAPNDQNSSIGGTIPTTVTTTTSPAAPPTSTNHHQNAPTMQAQTTQPTTNTTTTQTQPSSSEPVDFDDDYDSDSKDTLLTMTFNQDGGCLAVGTGSGFRICNVNPFQETFRRSLGGGGGSSDGGGAGIAHIEMLYRTNLLAITGHSTSPQYPPHKVLIYDDHLQRTIGELTFRQKVLTTKLRRDRIVVVLRDRVYIYNFSDLALLDKVHTGDNPLGLIGISMDNGGVGGSTTSVERAEDALGSGSVPRNNGMVLACPSTQRGQVRVELYGLRRTTFVDAHESALGALALSVDGSLLATASERGTVIRLFDTRGVTIGGGTGGGGAKKETTSVSSSVPLREFRRGVERATISCLTFSLDSNWLGCASDHGTVHIFQTHDPNNNNNASAEKKSRSSSMTGKAIRMLPKLVTSPKKYLMDGVQSYAQVRGVPHPQACAFVPDREQTLAVAGVDEYGNGCLLLAEFGKPINDNKKAGVGDSSKIDDSEARRLGYHRFFKCKSPASQTGSSRRRTKSSSKVIAEDTVEGGAYIDDAPVDMRMNHISIGDENEDHFVPIEYSET